MTPAEGSNGGGKQDQISKLGKISKFWGKAERLATKDHKERIGDAGEFLTGLTGFTATEFTEFFGLGA